MTVQFERKFNGRYWFTDKFRGYDVCLDNEKLDWCTCRWGSMCTARNVSCNCKHVKSAKAIIYESFKKN